LSDPITGDLFGVAQAERRAHRRATEPGYHFAVCMNICMRPSVRGLPGQ